MPMKTFELKKAHYISKDRLIHYYIEKTGETDYKVILMVSSTAIPFSLKIYQYDTIEEAEAAIPDLSVISFEKYKLED